MGRPQAPGSREAESDQQHEFARALRHELRTPVNHIIGYSEMLLDEAEPTGQTEVLGRLSQIASAGRLLIGHINEELTPAGIKLFGADLTRLRRQLSGPLHQIVADCDALQTLVLDKPQFTSDVAKIAAASNRLIELLDPNQASLNAALSGVAAESPGRAASVASEEPRADGRLLVVDDNEANRDMLSRRLQHMGYTVATAGGGRQALDMLRSAPFDILLLDILMPEMDGYQVLEEIKADTALSHLPVIVLSASDDVASIVRCVEMGAEDHLSKPFTPALLRARVGACMEKKRLHDKEASLLAQVRKEKKRADALLDVVIPIGVALTAEKDFDSLLERIVIESQALCNADGGTLYLRNDKDMLQWVIVRTGSLGIALGGTTGNPITFAPLQMYDPATGAPARHYVVTQAALIGATINIADAYDADGYDFSGTRAFDAANGYRSQSFVTVPLKDNQNRVIGVLQLINARDPETFTIVPFDDGQQQMLESLSSLAAVAVAAYAREQRLEQQIEELRIEVDEARKARQVAEITETDYFQRLQERARRMRNR